MTRLFWLLCGHAIADFALQSEFIARGKSRLSNPYAAACPWYYILAAHALTHGAAVAFVLGPIPGALECVAHFLIDWAKCEGLIDIHKDQAAHIGCKLLWLTLP